MDFFILFIYLEDLVKLDVLQQHGPKCPFSSLLLLADVCSVQFLHLFHSFGVFLTSEYSLSLGGLEASACF